MQYIPYEKMSITWSNPTKGKNESFKLTLPWVSMEYDVTEDNGKWINEATNNLHTNPAHKNVQRFISELKEYPVFYYKPRNLNEFKNLDLQECPEIAIDSSTPTNLVKAFGCPIDPSLMQAAPNQWRWDQAEILNKSRIPDTDLYDPVSLISYLICYRLDWDSHTWAGTDTFGTFLETILEKDETEFFKIIGWITKQSWYVTTESYNSMKPALTHFSKNGGWIEHFMTDEIGHYKFMEQVFVDLNLNRDDFPVGDATKWLIACHKRTAETSPLAFSAMINIFEAAYYEGDDPISRAIKLSSRPHAARGFDLHYKINQEHRHCDMPINLGSCLAPQTRPHVLLTVGLFELTLHFLDTMEQNLAFG